MSELYGVYAATVLDVRDPKRLGRVRVRLARREAPGLERLWARLATLMAGEGRGTWFVPDEGDEVLVAFEGGDARRPFVVGALWSASAKPPERMDKAGANPRRTIRTRGGHRIAFDDATHAVEIETADGQSVVLDAAGVTITAAAKVRVRAAQVEVEAPVARFSGLVGCETLVATSVVASSYTPGVGNIQ